MKIVDAFGYELSQRHYNPKNTLEGAIRERECLDKQSEKYQKLNRQIDEKKRLQSFHLAVSVEHIEEQILELIKLCRTALMYLALSIQYHESNKQDDGVSIRLDRHVPYI